MFNSRPKLISIGNISIKSLRDFILDNDINEKDTILLNQYNFDDIIFEFRNTYKVGIQIPYYLDTVLIEVNRQYSIPKDQIGVIKNAGYL